MELQDLLKQITVHSPDKIEFKGNYYDDYTDLAFFVAKANYDPTELTKKQNPTKKLIEKAVKKWEAEQDAEKLKEKISSMDSFSLPGYYPCSVEDIPLRFHPLNSEGTSYNIYSVVNKETNTLKLTVKAFSPASPGELSALLTYNDDGDKPKRDFADALYKSYVQTLDDPSKAMPITEVIKNEVRHTLLLQRELMITDPPEVVADSNETYNLSHFNTAYLDPIDKSKCEVWFDWLKKIPTDYHRKAFCEWLGSIFDHKNKSRNIMFLVGDGFTGKSVAMNTIYETLRNIVRSGAGVIDTENSDSRWLNSNALGKRFLMASDSSDVHFLSNQGVKKITGGDTAKIEFKGKDEFAADVYAKIAVVSNFTPYCNYSSSHETTRYMLIPIRPYRSDKYEGVKGSDYIQLLKDGCYDFLKFCYDKYVEAGRPDDYCYEGHPVYEYAKSETIDLEGGSHHYFVQANCELGERPGCFVNKSVMITALMTFYKASYRSYGHVKYLAHSNVKEIAKDYNLRELRLKNGEQVFIGIKIKDPSEIRTFDHITQAQDDKTVMYQVDESNIPEDAPEDIKRILSEGAYSRHLD